MLGVLFVSSQLPRKITPHEIKLLESMAEIAGSTFDRLRLLKEARRYTEKLEIINATSRALSESLKLEEIYEQLQGAICGLISKTSTVIFSLYDQEHELIIPAYVQHEGQVQYISILKPIPLEPPGSGLQSQVIHTRQPLISNQFRKDMKEKVKTVQNIRTGGPDTQSSLYVPMLAKDRVIGVINVQSFEEDYFTQDHANLLNLIGNTAAIAIENARLFEQTQTSLERLKSLREIDQAITASPSLHPTLHILLKQVIKQLKADAANVLILNPSNQTLEFANGLGFRTQALWHTKLAIGEGYAGQAALQRSLVEVQGLDQRQTDFLRSPFFSSEGFKVYFCMPLIAKGEVQGVLEVFLRSPFEANADWLAFLETLAGQAAIAIDNVRLFENLEQSNANLIKAYDATIEGWSKALDFRDKETEDHTLRVTEMTLVLARAMGIWSENELIYVRWGALLHDIGKIGIPDSILHKVQKLTNEEWDVIQQHPGIAYDLLNPIEFLHPALDIPYCHHEKWDGTGYPRGLKGDQIPLAARLFAIVDVWDALLSDRPYRPGWPEDKILAHFREQAGIHFDPQVVELFETLRSEMGVQMDFSKHAPSRLLIVDDDENALHSLSRSLRNSFAVLTARSGSEALELLGREKVAVILTDQQIPDMTGLDLLQEAQKICPETPGVLLSRHSNLASLAATLNLDNVYAYIPKPWDIDDLLQKLHTVIKGNNVTSADVEKNEEANSDEG